MICRPFSALQAARVPGVLPRRLAGLVAAWIFLAAGAALALAAGSAPARPPPDVPRPFHIPAGEGQIALEQFAEQADASIVYLVAHVQGVRTPAVRGDFTPREALQRLLTGTALTLEEDARTGTFTLKRGAKRAADPAALSPLPPERDVPPKQTMKRKTLITVLAGWLGLVAAPAQPSPETPAPETGSLTGTVLNETNGTFVANARVTIAAHGLEAFTDTYGRYQLARVPAGPASVRVDYIGFPAITHVVQVAAGQAAVRDFTLRSKTVTGDETITLDAFTVAAQADMAASDVAVNEQRYAPSIKNIVATDSFADIADGNVGEFAKFLPGVVLNRNGSDGTTISLGGVPPSGTPILVDGNGLASAASSSPSRQIEFENMSINSMARVEVDRSPMPDSPASAIGGSVNLISKSAFERTKPLYTFKVYASFPEEDFSFKKQPGPFDKKTYWYQPNLEFSAIVPVSRRFGFTVNGISTRTINNGPGTTQDWVPHQLAQSANYPATTPDAPYLARWRVQERPKITRREQISATADWRVTEHGVLTLGMQYAFFNSNWWVRQLNFDVGRVASFGDDFTQGAAGAGFVQTVYDATDKHGTTYMPSLRYRHRGPVWDWQIGGAFSRASNYYRDIDKGYFQASNAFFRNLTIRFEDFGYEAPRVVDVRDAQGNPVDAYDLSNYRLEAVTARWLTSSDIVRTAFFNAKRDLGFKVPFTVKTGIDVRSQSRDIRRPNTTRQFVGADGIARTADDNADQWYDPIYSQKDLLYGPRMEWMNLAAIGSTYASNPAYFPQTAAQEYSDHRNQVTGSQAITETIVAPYVRFDTKLWDGRVLVSGGVRYERTDDEGVGPLIDPTAIYQRDANGEIVRNSAGQPVVIAPLNSLLGSQLAYVERGSSTQSDYDGYFPSLNTSFILRPNLIARVSYGRSINRPDFGNILPSMSLPDTESTSRTITLTNPDLQPWIADSYGVALEYYFNEPSTGVVSARAYRRDISDFWGAVTVPASDDVLEPWGLDPEVYGEALGYVVSTRRNVGDARVSGLELDYRQNLTFLPRWARGVTLFGNITWQDLEGSEQASFAGFARKMANWGISLNRQRFAVRLAVNHRGLIQQNLITQAGAEAGTYQYLLPRTSADFTAEYRLTEHFGLYVSGRNINKEVDYTVRYGPSTPRDRIVVGRAGYGATWYVGVKGTF